jgi:hypothetical protein
MGHASGEQRRKGEPDRRARPLGQEKPLASQQLTVPETDTGGQGENPKARERTLVKELGKLTP